MMMQPGLDIDPTSLGLDASVVLGINGMTSAVKEWIEDRIPDSLLPAVRRFYVALPVLLAGLVCWVQDGFHLSQDTMQCAMKYGMGAAYLKMAHRSGWEGR